MISRKFIVRGKVQGVWFRESTRRVATELGISGHAINRPDGTVEVVARGDSKAIEQLESWLHEGPTMARVEELVPASCEEEIAEGFRTG